LAKFGPNRPTIRTNAAHTTHNSQKHGPKSPRKLNGPSYWAKRGLNRAKLGPSKLKFIQVGSIGPLRFSWASCVQKYYLGINAAQMTSRLTQPVYVLY
jgi:hypothetical protein